MIWTTSPKALSSPDSASFVCTRVTVLRNRLEVSPLGLISNGIRTSYGSKSSFCPQLNFNLELFELVNLFDPFVVWVPWHMDFCYSLTFYTKLRLGLYYLCF